MLTAKTKQPVVKMKSSPTSNSSSGAKFLKTITPNIRRRRQCDKEKLEIYNLETSSSENAAANDSSFHLYDVIPTTPITPPAAFLPPGYKKNPSLGEFHLESVWTRAVCTSYTVKLKDFGRFSLRIILQKINISSRSRAEQKSFFFGFTIMNSKILFLLLLFWHSIRYGFWCDNNVV